MQLPDEGLDVARELDDPAAVIVTAKLPPFARTGNKIDVSVSSIGDAASLEGGCCYSLVSGKDMVPRMSLWTVERLRDELMLCALRCKVPKLALALGAGQCQAGTDNITIEVFGKKSPNAADFVARKRALICKKAKDLGRLPDGSSDFDGIPYVMAADKTWIVEPDSFKVNKQIAADTLDVIVPSMLLQPLVENAVRHGIAGLIEGGTVVVSAVRAADRVVVTVSNPRDPDAPPRPGTRLGLDIVRRRLAAARRRWAC